MPPFCGRGREYTIFRDSFEIKRMRMTVCTRQSFLPPGDEAICRDAPETKWPPMHTLHCKAIIPEHSNW